MLNMPVNHRYSCIHHSLNDQKMPSELVDISNLPFAKSQKCDPKASRHASPVQLSDMRRCSDCSWSHQASTATQTCRWHGDRWPTSGKSHSLLDTKILLPIVTVFWTSTTFYHIRPTWVNNGGLSPMEECQSCLGVVASGSWLHCSEASPTQFWVSNAGCGTVAPTVEKRPLWHCRMANTCATGRENGVSQQKKHL